MTTRNISRKRHRRGWSRYSPWTFYLFLAPWLAGFVALTAIPLLYALLISFTSFDGFNWHWVGLRNYVELLHDPTTWSSLARTGVYVLVIVPLTIGGGLGLALLLNQRLRTAGLFRTIFYLPSLVPVVASAVIWKLIFDRDSGALNALLELAHGSAIAWLLDPYVFPALVIMVLWGLGGGMVITLAGLQGIPVELQEAAQIDGANSWQVFARVTFPLLSPILFFQVVTGVIYALQTLVQPLLLQQSLGFTSVASIPASNDFFLVNIYQQIFVNQRFGYGSALLWVLFLIILLVTLLVLRTSAFWVYYGENPDQ